MDQDHGHKGQFRAVKLPFAQEEGERGVEDGRLGIGLLRGPLWWGRHEIGLSSLLVFPLSPFEVLVFVPSLSSRYI